MGFPIQGLTMLSWGENVNQICRFGLAKPTRSAKTGLTPPHWPQLLAFQPSIHVSCVLNVLYPGTKQGNAYAASYVLPTRAQFCLRGINRLTQTLRWTFLVPGHSPSLRAATFTCRNRSVSRQHQAVEDDDVDEEDEADEDAATEEARR